MMNELIRERLAMTECSPPYAIIQGKKVINFCSNDYLGIAKHPSVINALIDGALRYGLGSGASPIVSGYCNAHRTCEEAFADYLKHERAILFSSGYAANISVLPAIATRNDVIASDKLIHASLLDGIQLSRAKHVRFSHQDFNAALASKPTIIVTESIFSMEGDITPVDTLINLTQHANIKVVLDTAHSFGLMKSPTVDYTITPLGKALASIGAIISGKHDQIEQVLQKSRSYHYSTALPPAIAYANIAALKILRDETWRLDKLNHLIQQFIKGARERNISLMTQEQTPIKTILIRDNQKTMQIKNKLLNEGYWIGGIRPPTVPKNMARLRISLSALHNEYMITRLLDAIAESL